jgi:hypothetical protein
LLEGWCFVAPISGAIASSSLARASFGGYALAIAIGLALGIGFVWTMFRAGRNMGARIKKQPESMQERNFSRLYFAAMLWIALGLFIGHWVSAVALRLVL